MAIRLPRIARISLALFVKISSPSKRTDPPAIRAPGGRRRMRVRASVVLPDPDSPTMPSVRPASSENDTSSTARVTRVPRAAT